MRYLIVAICIIGFASCMSNNTKTDTAQTSAANTTTQAAPTCKLNAGATNQLLVALNNYYLLKDAFVAGNTDDIASTAGAFAMITDSLKSNIAHDTAINNMIIHELDTIVSFSKKIASLPASSDLLEKQRALFENISDNTFTLCQKVELKNEIIYRDFCPMALNDKGAHWLSSESEIKNPYFGKKMLECGEITDSLK
jgi:hypothetical protein